MSEAARASPANRLETVLVCLACLPRLARVDILLPQLTRRGHQQANLLFVHGGSIRFPTRRTAQISNQLRSV